MPNTVFEADAVIRRTVSLIVFCKSSMLHVVRLALVKLLKVLDRHPDLLEEIKAA